MHILLTLYSVSSCRINEAAAFTYLAPISLILKLLNILGLVRYHFCIKTICYFINAQLYLQFNQFLAARSMRHLYFCDIPILSMKMSALGDTILRVHLNLVQLNAPFL